MARQRFVGGAAVPEPLTPLPPAPDTAHMLPGPDEIVYRRARVLTLWLRRMTQWDIAKALGVDQATISRDLAVIREQWRGKNGIPESLNRAEEVSEALAQLLHAETAPWEDYHRCNILTHPGARARFLLTAVAIRQQRINLLQDMNLLERAAGQGGLAISRTVMRGIQYRS